MLGFVLRRLAAMAGVLLALSVLVFGAGRLGGGDPVHSYLGANASDAAIAAARVRLGLDRPLPVQYWNWLVQLLHGDLGTSLSTKRSVAAELAARTPATLELAIATAVLSVLIALALARVYALPGRLGGAVRLVLLGAASAPAFLVATAGVLLLFSQLGWLPVSGRTSYGASSGLSGMYVLDGLLTGNPAYSWDALRHLILPAAAASLAPGVSLARVLADGLSVGLGSGYARTARSLGETEGQVLRRHALRNAAPPALTLLGVQLGTALSSLVVVEEIFSWNGLGQFLVSSIGAADTGAVATVTLMLGAGYVVLNAVVDVLAGVLDPRVRAA